MSCWNDPNKAPVDEDLLVKRDIGSFHVATLMEDGRWLDWYLNEIRGVVGWKRIDE